MVVETEVEPDLIVEGARPISRMSGLVYPFLREYLYLFDMRMEDIPPFELATVLDLAREKLEQAEFCSIEEANLRDLVIILKKMLVVREMIDEIDLEEWR